MCSPEVTPFALANVLTHKFLVVCLQEPGRSYAVLEGLIVRKSLFPTREIQHGPTFLTLSVKIVPGTVFA